MEGGGAVETYDELLVSGNWKKKKKKSESSEKQHAESRKGPEKSAPKKHKTDPRVRVGEARWKMSSITRKREAEELSDQ